ncbi:MAG: dihydrolipoamide acetyltransferase family protein, partial [Actinomycetota bacterium]
VETPSPWEGTIGRLHAAEGDVVKVGQPLVSIDVEGEAEEAKPKRTAVLVGYGVDQEDEVARARRARRSRAKADGAAKTADTPRATPPVRKLAKERGVDLASLAGTGPEGRITREDVERAAAPAPEASPRPTSAPQTPQPLTTQPDVIPVRGNRRLIAEHMTRSVGEIPHVTTWLTVDATWLLGFREELSVQAERRISPLPVVVRALADVCRDHPKLTSTFDSENVRIVLFSECNVGIAVDTPDGLLVPVVERADTRGVVEIAETIDSLSAAARERKLTPEQMRGGTITVTNVGSFGSESGTPIINHPEAAILALGVIEKRALVVDDDRVEARPACTLALTFDHRVLDGAEAGRALKAMKDLLESPFRLGALPR